MRLLQILSIGFFALLLSCSPTTTTMEVAGVTLPPDPIQPEPITVEYIFYDEFDGVLEEGWSWYGENQELWSLTSNPGSLQIMATKSNLTGGEPSNILTYPAPEGDFRDIHPLTFTPNSNFQMAGLLIAQAEGTYVIFGRGYTQCDSEIICQGNAIYFDNLYEYEFPGGNYATKVDDQSLAYLRLQKQGNTYTGYYSADGITWLNIGTHTNNMVPYSIGLAAFQAYEKDTIAIFDYFGLEIKP